MTRWLRSRRYGLRGGFSTVRNLFFTSWNVFLVVVVGTAPGIAGEETRHAGIVGRSAGAVAAAGVRPAGRPRGRRGAGHALRAHRRVRAARRDDPPPAGHARGARPRAPRVGPSLRAGAPAPPSRRGG